MNVLDDAVQADFQLKLDAHQMQNVLDVAAQVNILIKLDAHTRQNVRHVRQEDIRIKKARVNV